MSRASTMRELAISNAQRTTASKVRGALQCHLDNSHREIARRRAAGEDVTLVRVCSCAAIVPIAGPCFFCGDEEGAAV